MQSAKGIHGNALRHHQAGRIEEAVALYRRAVFLQPDYTAAHINLGVALVQQGRIDEAIEHYQRALALDPHAVDVLINLGTAVATQGRIDDAIAHYGRALDINPDNAKAHNGLGNIFKILGKFDDAMAHFERSIAIEPDYAEPHISRAEMKSFHPGDPDLAALERLAGMDVFSANNAPIIHFVLARAFEDCGDYARAFEHLRKGNDLKRRQIRYDEQATIKQFRRISTVFNGSLFDRFRGAGEPSPVPVFVVGMPRSGSTLVEQILASHPQVHGAGELTDLETATNTALGAGAVPFPDFVPSLDGATLRRIGQRYIAQLQALGNGRLRIVDKMPGNFLKIGLIRLILPNARIIHTMRDPIDTCVSCYSQTFTVGQEFSYDLGELGRYYRLYSGLMAHWRSVVPSGAILDVSYEDVVDDLEGQARRLIEYCGLPWDDRCLSFHETARPVKTASLVQVRKPLFRSSLERWRKYEGSLGPLLRELGDVVPLKIRQAAG
jgi:tetratricopeptide (TPR) repeat protein